MSCIHMSRMSSSQAVVRPPPRLFKKRFISLGATGWVYQVTEEIVLKSPRQADSGRLEYENTIYGLLEKHPPCPYIIQSLFRIDAANFMPFLPGGTLDKRLQCNQEREGNRVVSVLKVEDPRLINRWVAELSAAAAWLETLQLVHGDLCPPNMLLDAEDHLKLVDFDCAAPVGDPSLGDAPP